MEVGASVIAFATLALASTKSIYEAVAGIKDAPRRIQSLADSVADLQNVLIRLQTCQVLEEPHTGAQHLSDLLERCNRDVQRYEEAVKKFGIDSSGPKFRQKLRRVCLYIKDKDLESMSVELNRHTSKISLQLQILSQDEIIKLKDSCQSQVNAEERHFDQLRQHISTTTNSIQAAEAETIHEARHAFSSIERKLEQLPQACGSKTEDVLTLLRALQNQVSGIDARLASEDKSQPNIVVSSNSEEPDARCMMDSELEESIFRIRQLATQDEITLRDKDASQLLGDLALVLKTLSSQEPAVPPQETKRKREICAQDEMTGKSQLKRLRRVVKESNAVSIHSQGEARRMTQGGFYRQNHRVFHLATSLCQATLTIHERRTKISAESNENPSAKQYVGETVHKLKMLFDSGSQPAVVVAQLRQIQESWGFLCVYPTLIVGKILPKDSEVFRVVVSGDVERLQGMVSRHEVSLRDRNPDGTPLLHYAYQQPRMCKFLIDSGAEIDELARYVDVDEPQSFECGRDGRLHLCPAIGAGINDHVYSNFISARNECRRLLLDAGADPCISGGSGFDWDGIYHVLRTGNEETLKLLLDLGGPLIDQHRPIAFGWLPIHTLSSNNVPEPEIHSFRLLIQAGADIHARTFAGETVLHHYVRNLFFVGPREWNTLMYLIRNGSSVLAVRSNGASISHDAYTNSLCLEDYDCGSYVEDVWDVVLTKCGFDIRRIRQGYPRKAKYSSFYTRQDFERMWKGMEASCPYYHDPEIWHAPQISNFSLLGEEEEKAKAAESGILDDGLYYDENDDFPTGYQRYRDQLRREMISNEESFAASDESIQENVSGEG